MAIFKIINNKGRTHKHKIIKNCLSYVLQEEKVKDYYVGVEGPHAYKEITADSIFKSFIEDKKFFNKDSGKMLIHSVISFHPNEKIDFWGAFKFGEEFVQRVFKGYETLYAVHQDKGHIHIHFITNSVNYNNGKKFHSSKKDLQQIKNICNELSLKRGMKIPEKGKHYDGTIIEDRVSAWDKNKYYVLKEDMGNSYVYECYVANLLAISKCSTKDEYIAYMESIGWKTKWVDNRKYITFEKSETEKVRDKTIAKTFNIKDFNKGGILNELERNARQSNDNRNEQQYAREAQEECRSLRECKQEFEEEYQRELGEYYREVEEFIKSRGNPTTEDISIREGIANIEETQPAIREVSRREIERNKRKRSGQDNVHRYDVQTAEQDR